MVSVSQRRHISADSASVALLLADPSVDVPSVASLTAELAAPRRSGIGFTASVDLSAAGEPTANGLLTVSPAADAGCEVGLVLYASDGTDSRGLTRWSRDYLGSLASRAQARSFAA